MEKTSNDFVNLSTIPTEIKQYIAAYLDLSSLGFFAQSNKQTLKHILPVLVKYQTRFPSRLISSGHSTYLSQGSQLFVCGDNTFGKLGLEDNKRHFIFTAMPWPEERGTIKQIVAGTSHTVVLTQDNRLWACGYNGYGQLGLGDKALYSTSTFMAVPWPEERGTIAQVIAGKLHTIVLTDNNRLWVCGYNNFGQLGLGDEEDRASFTAVPWSEDRGSIQQVAAGFGHTIVLTQDNRLWVCGSHSYGQLGLGDQASCSTFTAVPWPSEQGRIEQVIAGTFHTIVLTKDNRLWVCGNNEMGQLGLRHKKHSTTFTAVPWPKERGKIEQISTSADHTVVLMQDNCLWVCGANDYGQLGLGNQAHRSTFTFTAVPWPKERGRIQQIIVGELHTVVLTEANRLWVCGDNRSGQLGLGVQKQRLGFGDQNQRFTFTLVEKLQVSKFNQLIKIGIELIQSTGNKTDIFPRQHQSDELEGQLPSKMMRL